MHQTSRINNCCVRHGYAKLDLAIRNTRNQSKMKIARRFSTSVYAILPLWLAIISSDTTEATIKYLTDYCGSNIDLNGFGNGSLSTFVLHSQPEGTYENCEDCSVAITASDPENYILLQFRVFEVEDSHECYYDKLKIYSMTERLTTSLGLCGESGDLPSDYLVNQRADLSFVTDSSMVKTGFEIVVAEVSRDIECGDNFYLCNNGHCISQYLDGENGLNISNYCGADYFISQGEEIGSNEISHEYYDDSCYSTATTEYYGWSIITGWTVTIIVGSTVGGMLVLSIIIVFIWVCKCCKGDTARPPTVAPISIISTSVPLNIPYPLQASSRTPCPQPSPVTIEMRPIDHLHARQPEVHCVQLPPIPGSEQQSQSPNQPFLISESTAINASVPDPGRSLGNKSGRHARSKKRGVRGKKSSHDGSSGTPH